MQLFFRPPRQSGSEESVTVRKPENALRRALHRVAVPPRHRAVWAVSHEHQSHNCGRKSDPHLTLPPPARPQEFVSDGLGFVPRPLVGTMSVGVLSLKRKYALEKRSSRIAIPVNRLIDFRSALLGGASSTSPSPSKNAPVILPSTSLVKAIVPSSKVMWIAARSSDAPR